MGGEYWKQGLSDDVAGLEVECSESAGFGSGGGGGSGGGEGYWWSTKKLLTCLTKPRSS